ncbi:MAG TPA: hypothetical protein VFK69_06465, partial [Candidatus Eisenbacteria bacterium]|nr:hypothetical protein [Candidatus Eisenbacteria bacterium]
GPLPAAPAAQPLAAASMPAFDMADPAALVEAALREAALAGLSLDDSIATRPEPTRIAADPRVRERLRFLQWMRRVQAEQRGTAPRAAEPRVPAALVR